MLMLLGVVMVGMVCVTAILIARPDASVGARDGSTGILTSTAHATVTETTTITQTAVPPTSKPTAPALPTASNPEPYTEPPQRKEWPPLPGGTLGVGKEWATAGPFGTQSTCVQNADRQPLSKSDCFQMPGGWFYYFVRQTRR